MWNFHFWTEQMQLYLHYILLLNGRNKSSPQSHHAFFLHQNFPIYKPFLLKCQNQTPCWKRLSWKRTVLTNLQQLWRIQSPSVVLPRTAFHQTPPLKGGHHLFLFFHMIIALQCPMTNGHDIWWEISGNGSFGSKNGPKRKKTHFEALRK